MPKDTPLYFYGKTFHKLIAFTQHAGLARDVKDLRLSARDMYLNPIISFLYWKMEYHCVHHMYPTIPSYNLDKLHNHIKDKHVKHSMIMGARCKDEHFIDQNQKSGIILTTDDGSLGIKGTVVNALDALRPDSQNKIFCCAFISIISGEV